MTPSKILRRFIDHGSFPTTQKEAAAMFAEARSMLLSKLPATGGIINSCDTARPKRGSTLERNCEFITESLKAARAVLSKTATPSEFDKIQAAHRKATRPVASKPAAPRATATAAKPAPSPITTTASAFAPSPIRMELAEFRKLNASQKMSYVKSGGKLI